MPQLGEIEKGELLGFKSCGRNRYIWLACPGCGKERWVMLSRHKKGIVRCWRCASKVRASARDFSGSNNYQWKGGRHIDKRKGYIVRWIPADSPYFSMVKGRKGRQSVWEHRLVMAEFLGRPLESWEAVHHLNGIRDDNRIENLSLVDKRKHERGTRVKILEQEVRLLQWQVKVLTKRMNEAGIPLSSDLASED